MKTQEIETIPVTTMHDLPEGFYTLPNWGQSEKCRVTAFAYLCRDDGGPFVIGNDGKFYSLNRLEPLEDKQAATGGHTPGPWHYRSAAHTKNLFGVSIFHGRDEKNEGLIADLSGRYKSYRTEAEIDPVTKANARLIASAPELLAALKSAESLLCAIGNEVRDGGGEIAYNAPYIPSILNKIVDAIAKAEGRVE